MSKEIRANLQPSEEGWAHLKAVAKIGSIAWKTAIGFHNKMKTYQFPPKAVTRKQEEVEAGIQITIEI